VLKLFDTFVAVSFGSSSTAAWPNAKRLLRPAVLASRQPDHAPALPVGDLGTDTPAPQLSL